MIKVAISLGLAIVFASLGDIMLSRGMQQNGEVKLNSARDLPAVIRHTFRTPAILIGVVSMALYFGLYMAALAWVDVSVANPLTALSYLVATFYAMVIMRERVCFMRWAGIVGIVLGAIFVGISS
jgi:drug/metabolite transporter (DMT)-like permease